MWQANAFIDKSILFHFLYILEMELEQASKRDKKIYLSENK